MATVPMQHAAVNHPFVASLGRLFQQGVGLASLVFGGAMLFTLWLIPLGLPLMLLGLALVSQRS
ncbi:MAG TPA: hypothetical protein VKE98_20815 [Gemmataceae bacterium]|nr:hypothetical protein [Gemmataceae bacterium]